MADISDETKREIELVSAETGIVVGIAALLWSKARIHEKHNTNEGFFDHLTGSFDEWTHRYWHTARGDNSKTWRDIFQDRPGADAFNLPGPTFGGFLASNPLITAVVGLLLLGQLFEINLSKELKDRNRKA